MEGLTIKHKTTAERCNTLAAHTTVHRTTYFYHKNWQNTKWCTKLMQVYWYWSSFLNYLYFRSKRMPSLQSKSLERISILHYTKKPHILNFGVLKIKPQPLENAKTRSHRVTTRATLHATLRFVAGNIAWVNTSWTLNAIYQATYRVSAPYYKLIKVVVFVFSIGKKVNMCIKYMNLKSI